MTKDNSEYLIERYNNVYEVVIGLEVHAQVTSNSKLFSSSSTTFGAEPNTQVSLVDAAFPGMLPVINEYCVKLIKDQYLIEKTIFMQIFHKVIKFHNLSFQ
jgi:aspartyl-tRNA(Asn)/glutamyl-tRNA(Gln) amidotransferase subunit B